MLNSFLVIFTALLFFALVKAVGQILVQRKCLSLEQIDDYKKGRLSSDERRLIHLHLGNCEKCQNLMTNENPEDLEKHLLE